MKVDPKQLEVMLPDTRGVTVSRYGKGNLKIGRNVVTYSKVAVDTCPGASDWCKKNCYAQRIAGLVLGVYQLNTANGSNVPDLPSGTTLVRIHVSGDFDSFDYVEKWRLIAEAHPETQFWAYTRSWRTELLPELEKFRKLPNVQLFASTDESIPENPPVGWRVAWIDGDPRAKGMKCPEELGTKQDCEQCKYCFMGKKGDVIFLRH